MGSQCRSLAASVCRVTLGREAEPDLVIGVQPSIRKDALQCRDNILSCPLRSIATETSLLHLVFVRFSYVLKNSWHCTCVQV